MRLVSVNRLQAGMKLGKKIYSDEGLVLLADGVELTDALIKRLARIDIGYIYIEDSVTEDVVIPGMLQDETRNQALKVIRNQFQQMSGASGITKGFYHLDKKFSKVMDSILDDMSAQEDPMIMLLDMHTADNYLYVHSLNVCLYTLVLGIAHGYSKEELRVIGLGSLLHDIGKTQIPVKIVQKPGMLSEDEFKHMQAHTEIGYRILKEEPNIPLLAAHCALQHHERIDGSGYPRGLTGPQIHEYAKWLGVADSYDAMTSNRIYKKPCCRIRRSRRCMSAPARCMSRSSWRFSETVWRSTLWGLPSSLAPARAVLWSRLIPAYRTDLLYACLTARKGKRSPHMSMIWARPSL